MIMICFVKDFFFWVLLTPLICAVIARVAGLVDEEQRAQKRRCDERVEAGESRPSHLDGYTGERAEAGGRPGVVFEISLLLLRVLRGMHLKKLSIYAPLAFLFPLLVELQARQVPA